MGYCFGMEAYKGPPPPKVGDEIYVDSALYVYRGRDDFRGGKVKVSRVRHQTSLFELWWVTVEERPGTEYNWTHLAPKQAELAARYGEERGRPDPDLEPEFNDDEADWRPA
jgi:hypothetical protein